ncbi:MAG: hypothetical protein HRU20_11560 [Pseudomonadales bacterium]|nr:hypothetical protein [Pseudomonadales bacterium]
MQIFDDEALKHFFLQSNSGMWLLTLLVVVIAIGVMGRVQTLATWLIKPAVESAFYNTILRRWLGPLLSKHKIIATFIRIQGLGESIVEAILYLLGTFFVVAFLSSTLTAVVLHVSVQGFIFSVYLLGLVFLAAVFTALLFSNMRYFYKLVHRLP